MGNSWIRNLRDAGDVLRLARNPAELTKALIPNRWLARKVLNEEGPGGVAGAPAEVAEALRKLRNQLKLEALDDEGRVDYAKLHTSPTFAEMKRVSGLLRAIDPAQMIDDDTRIAFWINLYNVLSIHGALALGIRESVMEVPSFFGVVAYRVGDFGLTLDESEHGVLRGLEARRTTRARRAQLCGLRCRGRRSRPCRANPDYLSLLPKRLRKSRGRAPVSPRACPRCAAGGPRSSISRRVRAGLPPIRLVPKLNHLTEKGDSLLFERVNSEGSGEPGEPYRAATSNRFGVP